MTPTKIDIRTIAIVKNNIKVKIVQNGNGSFFHIKEVFKKGKIELEPVGILIDVSQISVLSSKLLIPYEDVFTVVLAHEYGHAHLFYKGCNYTDEELAWQYSQLYCNCPLHYWTRLRDNSLESHRAFSIFNNIFSIEENINIPSNV